MTAWIVVTVVSKSSTSWLIETFITDWSSTMRNCAVAKAISAGQAMPVDGPTASTVSSAIASAFNCSSL